MFFVTTPPKQSVKSETLLIFINYRCFPDIDPSGTKLAPRTLHTTDNPKIVVDGVTVPIRK
jgi:hypothetical protein